MINRFMDFTCQVSFYDEIHSTIVKEHQLLMHKKNKTEYLFSRIQVIPEVDYELKPRARELT